MMRSNVKYAVASMQPMRLFNALSAQGVTVTDISSLGKETLFVVSKKHVAKLLEVSESLCYTIRIYGIGGLTRYAGLLLSRIGLVFALALCVAYVGWRWSMVGSIRFLGDEAHVAELEEVLKDLGVREGATKSKIDLSLISDELSQVSGVSRVQAYFSGVDLVLFVRDSVLGDASVDLSVGTAIKANSNCKITKMTVIAGTPKVKVGDIVTKGDLLVEGIEGEGKETHAVVPRAVIYGEVWFTSYEDFFPKREVVRRTGRVSVQRVFALGNREFGERKPSPFSESETEITEQVISKFIPLKVTNLAHYETSKSIEEFDFKTEQQELQQSTLLLAREKITLDCTVIDEYNIITKEQTYTRVRGVVVASKIVS